MKEKALTWLRIPSEQALKADQTRGTCATKVLEEGG